MKLDQNTASTIVRNVLGAANQRAQIQIEADLHAVPVKEVKALLRDAGIDLRSLKGEKKSSGWRHGDTVTRKKHYKKPEILPGPPEKPEELEEQAKKAYEEFGVPAFITESEQKAADDKENAAFRQRVESVSLTEKPDGSIGMAMKLVGPAEKLHSGGKAQAALESLTVIKVDGRDFESEFRQHMDDAIIKDNPCKLEPLPAGTDLKDAASGGLYRVENIASGEPLGQPCEAPSTMLLYGEAPQKIASLDEIFDGLRAKVEKLRDQRRELAEQLRKTDDLLTYISMRCDIITETAEGTEKKDPADCLTHIGET